MEKEGRSTEEKVLVPRSGWGILIMQILLIVASILGIVLSFLMLGNNTSSEGLFVIILLICFIYLVIFQWFIWPGFRVVNPNEALVLLLFGQYYGTIKQSGFYHVNPFCKNFNPGAEAMLPPDLAPQQTHAYLKKKSKISLKTMTLTNDKQKVNDLDGNPIEIGVIVIWRIINTAKAVFNVDNYMTYINVQADTAIRQVARLYPYDIGDDSNDGGDEKSLRGSSLEIADMLQKELQGKVESAGIEIMDVRIAHLAYSQEIAAAMLQRQQAKAIVMARQKIVEGAVGMVDMALSKLNDQKIVDLDDERKAQMVSNLMVVLCGNKDTQPIVNTGTLYQ